MWVSDLFVEAKIEEVIHIGPPLEYHSTWLSFDPSWLVNNLSEGRFFQPVRHIHSDCIKSYFEWRFSPSGDWQNLSFASDERARPGYQKKIAVPTFTHNGPIDLDDYAKDLQIDREVLCTLVEEDQWPDHLVHLRHTTDGWDLTDLEMKKLGIYPGGDFHPPVWYEVFNQSQWYRKLGLQDIYLRFIEEIWPENHMLNRQVMIESVYGLANSSQDVLWRTILEGLGLSFDELQSLNIIDAKKRLEEEFDIQIHIPDSMINPE